MANSIIHNRKNLSVTVHATSNVTLTIAGNNSVSNVAIDDEVLTGAAIKQIWASSPSGNGAYWTVKRNANTIIVMDSTSWFDFAGNGNLLNKDSSATLVLELHNAAEDEGFIMVELQKEGTVVTY
jgi:hypothetical protein